MIENASLDLLKIFYQVAKLGSITEASRQLFISQPAITQSVNKLENVLNCKLFLRSRKGVTLTSVGRQIFDKTETIMMQVKNISKIVEEQSEMLSGQLVIGCGTNLAKEILVTPIKNFLKLYPNINLKVVDFSLSDSLQKLTSGEIDIYFGQKVENIGVFKYTQVFESEYNFYCGADFNNKNVKSLNDICKLNVILQPSGTGSRKRLDNLLIENKLQIEKCIEVAGYNLVIELAKNNLGVAYLPSYLVIDSVKNKTLKPLFEKSFEQKFSIGYTIHNEHNFKALQKFIEMI